MAKMRPIDSRTRPPFCLDRSRAPACQRVSDGCIGSFLAMPSHQATVEKALQPAQSALLRTAEHSRYLAAIHDWKLIQPTKDVLIAQGQLERQSSHNWPETWKSLACHHGRKGLLNHRRILPSTVGRAWVNRWRDSSFIALPFWNVVPVGGRENPRNGNPIRGVGRTSISYGSRSTNCEGENWPP